MEQRTATIPFDLETAKKINIGEIAGRIVTEKGQNRAEIVYEDNSSNCPLLVVIHSISVSADWFSATGKALSSENRLLLEVPEYITFKDGELKTFLSLCLDLNLGNPVCSLKNLVKALSIQRIDCCKHSLDTSFSQRWFSSFLSNVSCLHKSTADKDLFSP